MKRALCGLLWGIVIGAAVEARAQQSIVLQEVLGSWRGDDTIQFVELLMFEDFQQALNNRAALVFEDETGSTQQTFLFTKVIIARQNDKAFAYRAGPQCQKARVRSLPPPAIS